MTTRAWRLVCQVDVLWRCDVPDAQGRICRVGCWRRLRGEERRGGESRRRKTKRKDFWSWRARAGILSVMDGGSLMMVGVILCVFSCVMLMITLIHSCIHIAFVASFCSNKSCQYIPSFPRPIWKANSTGPNSCPSKAVRKSRDWGCGSDGEDEWKNPHSVFTWGVGGHIWEDRGVGRLLWKIKDILSNILRATKYSVLGETQGQNKTLKKKLLKISPPLHRHLPSESNLQPLRGPLFIHDGQDPPSCLWDIKQIQLRGRTMMAGEARESHRNNSCTINTVTGNQKNLLHGLFQEEATLCPRGGRKVRFLPLLPRVSFQTIKGTPDWPLGSTFPAVPPSIHKCGRQKRPILQSNTKKGKIKVWFVVFFF